jgi:hypothetical protein
MKIFKEEQRFTQTWLVVLLISSTIVPILIVVNEYTKEGSSLSLNELLLTVGLVLIAPVLLFLFKLSTRIDEQGIHYKFFPIHFKFKTIAWHTISKAYVRTYDAISEYGGWGLKGGFFWRKSKGVAINVSGDIGIQLELTNGKKILLGTKLKDQAEQVLKTYATNIKSNSIENAS